MLSILIAPTLQAQKNPSFIGIRTGVSVPFGSYSSNTIYQGSFTQTGFNVSAEGAWFFSKSFGVGAYFGYDVHPIDVGSLGQARLDTDPFLIDITIRSDPFRLMTGTVGFYYDFQATKDLHWTSKIMAGAMYGITPYQLHKSEYYLVGFEWDEITSAKDVGFAGLIGTGLEYAFNDYVGLYLDVNTYYSRLNFDFYSIGGTSRTETKDVVVFTTVLGIKIRL